MEPNWRQPGLKQGRRNFKDGTVPAPAMSRRCTHDTVLAGGRAQPRPGSIPSRRSQGSLSLQLVVRRRHSALNSLCAVALAIAAAACASLPMAADAAQYKVGESNGWNAGLTKDWIDAWVAKITFKVNDTLYFKYIPTEHNVMEVNQTAYQNCYRTSPIQVHTTGETLVPLTRPGWWYFIDGFNSWCEEGVRIGVNVTAEPGEGGGGGVGPVQPGPPASSSSSSSTGVVVGVCVAAALGLLLFVVGGVCCFRRRRGRGQEDIEAVVPGKNYDGAVTELSSAGYGTSSGTQNFSILDAMHVRPYTLPQIKDFTVNFQKEIGKGGYGPVYYGKLGDGREVAVKVCSADSQQGANEFINEVRLLSLLHHRNIVPLVGYCQEDREQILLYEYMQGGDLRTRLDGANAEHGLLSWKERLGIALDAAKGLEYLHTGASMPIIHRDIKASNILLTDKLLAKVADFGLSKLAPSEDLTHISTNVKGTAGYLDPEYYVTRQLTEGSDVYSFGILLLEIVSGRPPIFQLVPGTNSGIVEWVKNNLQSATIENIVDSRLQGDFEEDSVWKVVEVGLQCVDRQRQSRPSMSAVVRELKQAVNIELGFATSDRSNAIASFLTRAAANKPPSGKMGNDATDFNSPVDLSVIKSQGGNSSQDNSADQADVHDTYHPSPR